MSENKVPSRPSSARVSSGNCEKQSDSPRVRSARSSFSTDKKNDKPLLVETLKNNMPRLEFGVENNVEESENINETTGNLSNRTLTEQRVSARSVAKDESNNDAPADLIQENENCEENKENSNSEEGQKSNRTLTTSHEAGENKPTPRNEKNEGNLSSRSHKSQINNEENQNGNLSSRSQKSQANEEKEKGNLTNRSNKNQQIKEESSANANLTNRSQKSTHNGQENHKQENGHAQKNNENGEHEHANGNVSSRSQKGAAPHKEEHHKQDAVGLA